MVIDDARWKPIVEDPRSAAMSRAYHESAPKRSNELTAKGLPHNSIWRQSR